MSARGISLRRNFFAGQKWVTDPGHADKLVIKQELGAHLRRGGSKQADLKIDETFPKRPRILVRLGCKPEADMRRCMHYCRDDGAGKEFQKRFADANGKRPFQRGNVHLGNLWSENRSHIPGEFMDAITQFGGARSPPHPANVLSRHGSGQELRTNQLRVAQLHRPVTLVKQVGHWVCVNSRLTREALPIRISDLPGRLSQIMDMIIAYR